MKNNLVVLGVVLAGLAFAEGEPKVKPASEDVAGFKRILERAEKFCPEEVKEAKSKGELVASEYVYTPKASPSRKYIYNIEKDGATVGTLTILGSSGRVMKNLRLRDCVVE